MAKKKTPTAQDAVTALLLQGLKGLEGAGEGVKAQDVGKIGSKILKRIDDALVSLAGSPVGAMEDRQALQSLRTQIAQDIKAGGKNLSALSMQAENLISQQAQTGAMSKAIKGRAAESEARWAESQKAAEARKQADYDAMAGARKQSELESEKAAMNATKMDEASRSYASKREQEMQEIERKAAEKKAKEEAEALSAKERRAAERKVGKNAVTLRNRSKGLMGKAGLKAQKAVKGLTGSSGLAGFAGETVRQAPTLAVLSLLSQLAGWGKEQIDVTRELGALSEMTPNRTVDDYLEDMKNEKAAMSRMTQMAGGNQQAMEAMLQSMTPPGEVMFGAIPNQQQAPMGGASLDQILGQLSLG